MTDDKLAEVIPLIRDKKTRDIIKNQFLIAPKRGQKKVKAEKKDG